MTALKVLVVAMGVLIVLAVAAIVYGIATRLDLSKSASFDGRVELPQGGRILDMTASGDRLVLRVAVADGGERLIVVDLARGKQLGVLDLVKP